MGKAGRESAASVLTVGTGTKIMQAIFPELMTVEGDYFASMLLALMNKSYFIDLKRQKFENVKREIREKEIKKWEN